MFRQTSVYAYKIRFKRLGFGGRIRSRWGDLPRGRIPSIDEILISPRIVQPIPIVHRHPRLTSDEPQLRPLDPCNKKPPAYSQ